MSTSSLSYPAVANGNAVTYETNFNSVLTFPLHAWYEWGYLHNPITASDIDISRVKHSYALLQEQLGGDGNPIYGLHTSYGENERNRLDPSQWKETQVNLLEYLRVGVGAPLPKSVVRRALKLQALKTAHGLSGIHPSTYQALLKLANSERLPRVPRKGSLGASGDLISMAHAISPLFEQGPRGPRDVIGLVNTNSMMASWAIEHDYQLRKLLRDCFKSVALTSMAIGAGDEHFSEGLSYGEVHGSYARAGQLLTQLRRDYLRSSRVIEGKKSLLQARYSVRCAPQILGHCLDLLDYSEAKIRSEATAVADNPLILESGPWHGGLFYAIGLAASAEFMQEIIHRLAEMLDRQILILMDHRLNGGLPDNLNVESFNHCKGIHQLSSALFQEIKARSTPVRQMSFSCEGNNQDLVPCGMTALNNISDQLDSLREIIRAATFCSARAAIMRSSGDLPEALKLVNWSQYTTSQLESIL
ncbi:aromatic amino acid ammonia-lyase [Microbulbifer sp. CnH-101-G]|uniref:aromatic amino acid ammonia-lyase n=1 Tax=Microbulbifer sp. CnH-101-G TaxID=3243393 RepID=UPI0040399AD6